MWWKAGRITIKATGAETGGQLAQFESTDPRGSAPPMHIHRNGDELLYVLDGEVTVLVGDERLDLAQGDFAFVPRGVVHSYIVRSERARMLGTITPGGFGAAVRDQGPAGDRLPSSPPKRCSCRSGS